MCGIVGVAGNLNLAEENLFHNMLMCDTLRGRDSTGMIQVARDLRATWYKSLQEGPEFIENPKVLDLTKGLSSVLIGHNRAATLGKVTAKNAHPFEHGTIYGVHNGTLDDVRSLPKWTEFEVDSDNLIYTIAIEGIESAYYKMEGAAALVWWNYSNNTLYFIRNEQRPLSYARLRDGTLVWASDADMLKYCVRNTRGTSSIAEVESFEVDHLYSFKIPEGKEITNFNRIKPRIKKLTPSPYANMYNYGNWNQGGNRKASGKRRTTGSNTKTTTTTTKPANEESKVITLPPPSKTLRPDQVMQKKEELMDTVGTVITCHLDQFNKSLGTAQGHSNHLSADVFMYNYHKTFSKEDIEEFDTIIVRAPVNYISTNTDANSPFVRLVLDHSSLEVLSKVKKKPSRTVIEPITIEELSEEGFSKILGTYFPNDEWDTLVQSGCSACGTVANRIDADELEWTHDLNYFCNHVCKDLYERYYGVKN